jgi:hypothetical protein
LEELSLSLCKQALGRGSRSLEHIATGTIVMKNPCTWQAHRFLETLETVDSENVEALRLNC